MCLCSSVTFFFISFTSAAASESPIFEPILQVPVSPSTIPGVNTVLRDPQAVSLIPDDRASAEQTLRNLTSQWSDKPSKAKRVPTIKSLQCALAVHYFFQDAAYEELLRKKQSDGSTSRLSEASDVILKMARSVVTSIQTGEARAYAKYAEAIMQFEARNSIVEAAVALQRPTAAALRPELKKQLELIVLINRAETDIKAKKVLQQFAGIGAPAEYAVSVNFALAKAYSEMNPKYRFVYGAYLNAGLIKAKELGQIDQLRAVGFSVDLWKKVSAATFAWSSSLVNWEKLPVIAGANSVLEQIALEHWRRGDLDGAIQLHQVLTARMTEPSEVSFVEKRVLELRLTAFRATGVSNLYEDEIIRLRQKYNADHAADAKNLSIAIVMAQELCDRHRQLIIDLLGKAKAPGADLSRRHTAINAIKKYAGFGQSSEGAEDYLYEAANLHVASREYRDAAPLYVELALKYPASSRVGEYFDKAIEFQRIIVGWPSNPPWNGRFPTTPQPDRERLLTLYQYRAGQSKSVNWQLLAHIGLLQCSLGRNSSAFELWNKTLKTHFQGNVAGSAAGYMMNEYRRTSHWTELEATARLAIQNRITPSIAGKPTDAREFLGVALFRGGTDYLATKQFSGALAKFQEYVRDFRTAGNRDEALNDVSIAAQGSRQFSAALTALSELCESYPKSQYFRQALLTGGDLASGMALERDAAQFYSQFIRSFPRDREKARIQELLAEIDFAIGNYPEATTILTAESVDSSAPLEKRRNAAGMLLGLQNRIGNVTGALAASRMVESMAASADADLVAALKTQAKIYVISGREQDLHKVVNRLSSIARSSAYATDALAEVRLAQVSRRTNDRIQKVKALSIDKPERTLKALIENRDQFKTDYESVCDLGSTVSCALSLDSYVRIGREMWERANKLVIEDALHEDRVASFNSSKAAFVQKVNADIDSAESRWRGMMSQGTLNQDIAQQLTWRTKSPQIEPMNVNHIGEGFVQWNFPSETQVTLAH